MKQFLPTTMEEVKERGWDELDFVYISGDAYVDHPSFGAAIICRTLESRGYKVGIIAQPNWKTNEDFMRLGKPRLAFLVSSGNIDSMVNHYSVAKKRRKKDSYSNNGEGYHRPDRAVIVYCNKLREIYKDSTIIIGGIEASLRRLSHYDYWDDKVRKSVLVDSNADLLMYGMGENSIVEIAEALDSGLDVQYLTYLDGTVFKTKDLDVLAEGYLMLPSYDEVSTDKIKYAESFKKQYLNTDHYNAKVLVEPYNGFYIVQNKPNRPLTTTEFDDTYELPYMRTYHPSYDYIPAIEEVKFSLTSNRGCIGACNFCALNFHQGRIIQTRSHESLVDEATNMTKDPDFKGYIHDVGGPTANFRHKSCAKQEEHGACPGKQCLWPKPCTSLKVDHSDYVELLEKLRKIEGVKKVFIRSGIRYDYLMYDKDETFFRTLVKNHISGQLKVAPEHISNSVLDKMGKPRRGLYEKFVDKYQMINKQMDMNQFLVPYLMSSHPGSDLNSAIELAEYLRDIHHQPEQVQDFYPTPGTLSTAMYYTELDPRDMRPVYVAKDPEKKAMQRALMQYKNPKYYDLVVKALKQAGREDLIGTDKKCLIKPKSAHAYQQYAKKNNKRYDGRKRRPEKRRAH